MIPAWVKIQVHSSVLYGLLRDRQLHPSQIQFNLSAEFLSDRVIEEVLSEAWKESAGFLMLRHNPLKKQWTSKARKLIKIFFQISLEVCQLVIFFPTVAADTSDTC